MATPLYYVYLESGIGGPFTEAELLVLRQTGRINSDTLVRSTGDTEWRTMSQRFGTGPQPLRNYYEVLNVSETASDEVIRAAFKVLSLRHHPDRNNNSAESVKAMQLLNDAHATLTDSKRRSDYDAKLRYLRAQVPADSGVSSRQTETPKSPSNQQSARREWWRTLMLILFWDIRITLFAVIMIFGAIGSLFDKRRPVVPYTSSPAPLTSSSSYTSPPLSSQRPPYSRPSLTPFAEPWPSRASYLKGPASLAVGGLSSVTIDNSKNTSDVYLKLVWLSESQAYPVRQCYIPAGSSFIITDVRPGSYDVRYQDLNYGGFSKTESFVLHETPTASGTSYSTLSLTLYKVAHGNMHTEAIDASQF